MARVTQVGSFVEKMQSSSFVAVADHTRSCPPAVDEPHAEIGEMIRMVGRLRHGLNSTDRLLRAGSSPRTVGTCPTSTSTTRRPRRCGPRCSRPTPPRSDWSATRRRSTARGSRRRRCSRTRASGVAASLGAEPVEVSSRPGGTEAINLGIKGLFWARQGDAARPRIILPAPSTTPRSTRRLARAARGRDLDWIAGRRGGPHRSRRPRGGARRSGGADVALVTALWANNEVGTLQPVAEHRRARGPVRRARAPGRDRRLRLPADRLRRVGLAALSISAHKIGGPVGVGALAVARSAQVEPLVHGGNQQRATLGHQDAAGAAAFGVAPRSSPPTWPPTPPPRVPARPADRGHPRLCADRGAPR